MVEAEAGTATQVRVPWTRLGALATLPGVRQLREPWRPSPKLGVGEVVSEGYDQVMIRDWHGDGVTGAGVRVGVVDVGFADLDAILGNEIPSDSETFFDDGAPESTAHGGAVAEVIHDFAPDAALTLVSFGTDVEFGQALQTMLDTEQHIVNASVGFDNVWHADGTSPVTRYADAAVAAGVSYVAAAGNENERYRVGELEYEEGSEYLDIAGHYAILLADGSGQAWVSLRWSEPFGEAAQDIDLLLVNAGDQRECGRSENPQDGDDDPYEEVIVSGCEEDIYAVAYSTSGADVAGLTAYLYSAYGFAEGEATSTQSLTLPGDCFACVSVGAYDYEAEAIESYSSHGPTGDGRIKPDVVGPSGVRTASVEDFAGSSAAAPHAAGLLALWESRTGIHGEPEEGRSWLLAEARDLGPGGADNVYGSGAIQADELPPPDCGCGPRGAPVQVAVGIAGLFAVGRRRGRP